MSTARRKIDMGEHLIDGQFRSDKYPWCERGFVPLKVTDPMAQPVLWEYARLREEVDAEFSADLREALKLAGYEGKEVTHGRDTETDPAKLMVRRLRECADGLEDGRYRIERGDIEAAAGDLPGVHQYFMINSEVAATTGRRRLAVDYTDLAAAARYQELTSEDRRMVDARQVHRRHIGDGPGAVDSAGPPA